ncbi:unnamed protein product [Calicophoron daubneyi]|uniref:EF-hand domain-containing protein n=1 Tax=Calicophoron daubneyi TaxID=300641 RepID=A0AAV2T511_CALDB
MGNAFSQSKPRKMSVDTFFAIDEDKDNTISTSELETYVRRNSLRKFMIKQWCNRFDPEGTGKITLSRFCKVLGLTEEELLNIQEKLNAKIQPNEQVHTIESTMSVVDRKAVIETVLSLGRQGCSDPQDLCDKIKKQLDTSYGRVWNVCLSKGSVWGSISSIAEHYILFMKQGYQYMIWKTSE